MKVSRSSYSYRDKFNEDLSSKVINSYRDFMNLSDDEELTEDMLDNFSVSTIASRVNVPVDRVRNILLGKK